MTSIDLVADPLYDCHGLCSLPAYASKVLTWTITQTKPLCSSGFESMHFANASTRSLCRRHLGLARRFCSRTLRSSTGSPHSGSALLAVGFSRAPEKDNLRELPPSRLTANTTNTLKAKDYPRCPPEVQPKAYQGESAAANHPRTPHLPPLRPFRPLRGHRCPRSHWHLPHSSPTRMRSSPREERGGRAIAFTASTKGTVRLFTPL
ncbi:hypothetical protein B0H12DRAFT_773493 [Mycena haematopus]|nr:hypothetical protein B0H12DRAFT_773493 [Mycena haematopus]